MKKRAKAEGKAFDYALGAFLILFCGYILLKVMLG